MSKTKAALAAELKKLRAAYKKQKADKSGKKAYSRSSRSKVGGYGASMGSALGSALGGKPGAAIGGLIGKGADALYQKITGHGDYKVSSNSIVSGIDPPMFAKHGRGTIVKHREFITDVTSSLAFASSVYAINAANKGAFPWLAQVAANYEEYIIRGMVFEFKSTSADALNSTNTALGTVIMATRYNVLMPAFASKQEMENYEFCSSTKPSESCLHAVECAVGESPLHVLYTRVGETVVGDRRMYDLGNFQISTVGMQAGGVVIGELWVTYDVELLKPRISGVSAGYEADHWRGSFSGYASGSALGSVPMLYQGSNFGSVATPNSVVVPDWPTDYYFMLQYVAFGTSTTLVTPLDTTIISPGSGGCLTLQQVWNGSLTDKEQDFAGIVCNKTRFGAIYRFTAGPTTLIPANRTITFNAHTPVNTCSGIDLWIIGLNQPLTSLVPLLASESKRAIEDDAADEAYDLERERLREEYEFKKLARERVRERLELKAKLPAEPEDESPDESDFKEFVRARRLGGTPRPAVSVGESVEEPKVKPKSLSVK